MDSQEIKQIDEQAAKKSNNADADSLTTDDSNDPMRMRKAAAELAGQKQIKQAADLYRKVMQGYAASGKILSAIATKALELKISRRASTNARDIYDALRSIAANNIPSYEFFTKMSYDELLSILQAFEVEVFPPNSIVKKPGEPETDLYFVISGTLQETIVQEGQENPENRVTLIENAFTGDIYPFEEDKVCNSMLMSVTEVELLKIAKTDLIRLAQKKCNF